MTKNQAAKCQSHCLPHLHARIIRQARPGFSRLLSLSLSFLRSHANATNGDAACNRYTSKLEGEFSLNGRRTDGRRTSDGDEDNDGFEERDAAKMISERRGEERRG